MSRELLQQALDKFEHLWEIGIDAEYKVDLMPEIRALRVELAKPEQIITPISPDQYERFCGKCGACLGKPWVGLTHEEAQEIAKRLVDDVAYCSTHYAIAIEAALKEKNGAL